MQNMQEFNPWVGQISWRRAWQPTPVFLPGESHGQRSLAGYSPWGHTESNSSVVLKNTLSWGWNGYLHDASYLLQASDEFLRNKYQHSCFIQYHFWKEYSPEKYLIFRLKWILLDTSYPVGCLISHNVIISPVVHGQIGRQGNLIVLQSELRTWKSALF